MPGLSLPPITSRGMEPGRDPLGVAQLWGCSAPWGDAPDPGTKPVWGHGPSDGLKGRGSSSGTGIPELECRRAERLESRLAIPGMLCTCHRGH